MTPELLYTPRERKANGVFYTPNFLAEYLAQKIVKYTDGRQILSVLDPACGDSQLLRALSAQTVYSPLLIGVDKDANAVAASSKLCVGQNTRFYNTDGLFPTKNRNSIVSWQELRKEVDCEKGFDVVLSNPPWGAELLDYPSQLISQNFELAKGQFDSYDLFVEVALNNLIPNGLYGLILPDSLFTQEQARLRKLLATTTTINLIARLGEKIFPEIFRACVLIVGTKGVAPLKHKVDCFRLSPTHKKDVIDKKLTLELAEKDLSHQVLQSRFASNANYIFDIDLKADDQKTFEQIQKASVPLRQIVLNTRGAEISKRGKACLCPNCGLWFPYPKSKQPRCSHCKTHVDLEVVLSERIVTSQDGAGSIPLKTGEDLFRYQSISKSWIDVTKNGINYKNLGIYNGNKILVRKTGVGVTAAMDYSNAITTQVVYIFKLKPAVSSVLTLEFVLAVLNSRAMTYFLLKKFGENEWKSHPYLTQTMLLELPFPQQALAKSNFKPLIDEVTSLVQHELKSTKERNISKESDIRIEQIIAKCFALNKSDYTEIFDTIDAAEPLIPIKRLQNCLLTDIFPE